MKESPGARNIERVASITRISKTDFFLRDIRRHHPIASSFGNSPRAAAY